MEYPKLVKANNVLFFELNKFYTLFAFIAFISAFYLSFVLRPDSLIIRTRDLLKVRALSIASIVMCIR